MTLKRIMSLIGAVILLGGILTTATIWVVRADDTHQKVQRSLPEIVDALDKITDKLEAEEAEKKHTAKLCRMGKIIDRALCASVGVNIPDGG